MKDKIIRIAYEASGSLRTSDELAFIKSMKHLCCRTAEISEIDCEVIKLINRSDYNNVDGFEYTIDMIELIEENKTEPERTPTPGEYVEVSNNAGGRYKRIYLFTNNNNVHYYVCAGSELDYNNGNPFICAQAIDIRQLQNKQTYTIEATEEQRDKIQSIINK